MKTHVLTGALLATLAPASPGLTHPHVSAESVVGTSAAGKGTMSFGDDGHGRGYFRFDVQDDGEMTASLLFAGENHHHMFPDVVVELGTLDELTFEPGSVTFAGSGRLHDDPVTVTVQAFDNAETEDADRFVVLCTDPDGEEVFHADGDLLRGDISVQSP